MDMVTRGEIDGYASIYTFSSEQKVVPVCRIGSSEYFYAVNKNRPDLLAELNMALAGIQDEDLMSIPVIFISVNQQAELDCLKLGAMDFIPKPYPDTDIIKARIARCIELSENRDLIRRTQRDKLTGLYHFEYFIRYVSRYDQHYRDAAFDAVSCSVSQFYAVNERYGRQFGDLVLRSVGIGIGKLARRVGGIGCREEGDAFLLYCPHQDDYEQLLEKFMADLFVEKETASKVSLKFGVYANAQQEPDIEERFDRAKRAADNVENGSQSIGFYEFNKR